MDQLLLHVTTSMDVVSRYQAVNRKQNYIIECKTYSSISINFPSDQYVGIVLLSQIFEIRFTS